MARTDVLVDVRRSESAALAPVTVDAWRYEAAGLVEYDERTVLVGGPLLMACTAVLSALGNRRRRRAAERAAHRWHSLGRVRVVVAGRRLLVCSASTVSGGTVARVHAHEAYACADVLFADAPPLRLAGRDLDVIVNALHGAPRDGGGPPEA